MKDTPKDEWTPTMWDWANRQISFISRMKGNKGGLYDDKGNKTRKHTSLLIWGHNPEKFEGGGEIEDTKESILKAKDKDYVYLYHASPIKLDYIKTSDKSNFKFSEKGFVYLATNPNNAKGYVALSGSKPYLYRVRVKKDELLPDSGFIKINGGKNTLQDSINLYGLARVERPVYGNEIELIESPKFEGGGVTIIPKEIFLRIFPKMWDDFNSLERLNLLIGYGVSNEVYYKKYSSLNFYDLPTDIQEELYSFFSYRGYEIANEMNDIEKEGIINSFSKQQGGTLNNEQMQEFEMLKQQAQQELKGFETEKSEHNKTLEKLEEHSISKDEAISEIAESHLEENPNYYDKEDCGCEHDEFGRGGSMINKRMKYRKNYTEQGGKYGYGSVEKEDIDLNRPEWAKSENVLSYMQVKKGDYVGVKTKDGYTKGYVKDKPDYSYIVLDNGLEYDYQNSVLYTNLPKEEKQDNKSDFNENLKDEYKEQRQLLDEFFTPKYIAQIMYKIALKHGFKGTGKVLETSFGGGVFIDVLLENGIKESDIWGFEIFAQSFNMAKINYPKANLINHNFEYEFAKETKALNRDGIFQSEEFKKTDFDLIIGNPPYGSHKSPYSYLFDKDLQIRIEGFFIYLSLQKLKKGELLVFIINSLWLYNSEKYNIQKEKIFAIGDLIDAYRLPNNIFKGENRDTSIATDIVVFRKK